MSNKKILKIVLIIVILLILVDQVSKILIDKLVLDETVILQNVFSITKVQNEGIAFGINKENLTNIFLIIFVLVVVIRFIITQKKNLNIKNTIFLSMIIAGGASNLIDRIIRGAVLDFIKIGDFPVFNLADAFIVIGWVLFIIDLIKNIREVSS